MGRVVLPSVACLFPPYLFPLYLKNTRFSGKRLPNVKCMFWFSLQIFSTNLSETFFIITRIERVMIKMCFGFDIKYLLFLSSDTRESRYFTVDFGKEIKYQISWKSVQWESSCSLWTDKQTYRRRHSAYSAERIYECTPTRLAQTAPYPTRQEADNCIYALLI
jgi:hypothetical protein